MRKGRDNMAQETKRYYWLKFHDDFFSSKRIKKLRKLPNGDTCLVIYLKMQLKALKTDGILTFTSVEDTFASDVALDIDEDEELVAQTIDFLLKHNLLLTSDSLEYLLPFVAENTGSETAAAQRSREHRDNMTDEEKEKERERARLAMQKKGLQKKNRPNVTNLLRTRYEHVANMLRT